MVLTDALNTKPTSFSPAGKDERGGFEFNPSGNDLNGLEQNYGMILASKKESDFLLSKAISNEKRIASDESVLYSVEFTFPMQAKTNSVDCLAGRTCLPIGGYSVWSTIDPLQDDGKKTVFATTQMDTTALFHDKAVGAESAVSGTVALMGAYEVLANTPSFSSLPRRVVFSFFQGEVYGRVGSRKLLDDLQTFSCSTFKSGTDNTECSSPFKPDLEFQDLKVADIHSVLDVSQINADSGKLYAHTENSDSVTNELVAELQSMTVSGLSVDEAASTPGVVPPSSYLSFLEANSSTPGVVLTGYESVYSNKFYHSMYDTKDDAFIVDSLSRVSTLLARTLYVAAGGEKTVADTLTADDVLVRNLYTCLTDTSNPKCSTSYAEVATVPIHYSSVYVIRPRSSISGPSRFVRDFLQTVATNATTVFHDAVDPDLTFTGSKWEVKEGSSGPIWTESK